MHPSPSHCLIDAIAIVLDNHAAWPNIALQDWLIFEKAVGDDAQHAARFEMGERLLQKGRRRAIVGGDAGVERWIRDNALVLAMHIGKDIRWVKMIDRQMIFQQRA